MNLALKRIRNQMLMCGLIVAIACLVATSCSDALEEIELTQSPTSESTEELGSSKLHFSTIEEFEAIVPADISHDYEDYKLHTLHYECVDTIEMRALLLDVEARLVDGDGRMVNVSFQAEVGPELVSVEYYPKVDVFPVGNFLAPGYYGMVERYRNYSDGSRIGPDEFYDYGHFIGCPELSQDGDFDGDEIYSSHRRVAPISEADLALYHPHYKDGKHYCYGLSDVEINKNATLYTDDGHYLQWEDFVVSKTLPLDLGEPQHMMTQEVWDFYGVIGGRSLYHYSRGPAEWTDEIDESTMEIYNMCKDVPDVSPKPYPLDTQNLNPGFYFGDFLERYFDDIEVFSNYKLYDSFWSPSFRILLLVNIDLNYFVCDGRIIHFIDLCDYHYLGSSTQISKKDNEYTIHREASMSAFGATFVGEYDFVERLVDGESIVVDRRGYGGLDWQDNDVMNTLTRATDEKAKIIPREDGKYVVVKDLLPPSIINKPTSKTLYK